MDVNLEAEESKYISLYCSDYIREAIECAAYSREQKKSATKIPQEENYVSD